MDRVALPTPIGQLIPLPSILATVASEVQISIRSGANISAGLHNNHDGNVSITLLRHEYLCCAMPHATKQMLAQLIDSLGEASARAQRLPAVITTYQKLLQSSDQRTYIAYDGRAALGFIKVGHKQLFVSVPAYVRHASPSKAEVGVQIGRSAAIDRRVSHGRGHVNVPEVRAPTGSGIDGAGSSIVEMTPLCVLDFFVCESVRRSGVGKLLFETMLKTEGRLEALERHRAAVAAASQQLDSYGRPRGMPINRRRAAAGTDNQPSFVEPGSKSESSVIAEAAPIHPSRLAYDRPSHMFLSFLRRHYGLESYTPQANNYVVYHEYWSGPRHQPSADVRAADDGFAAGQQYQSLRGAVVSGTPGGGAALTRQPTTSVAAVPAQTPHSLSSSASSQKQLFSTTVSPSARSPYASDADAAQQWRQPSERDSVPRLDSTAQQRHQSSSTSSRDVAFPSGGDVVDSMRAMNLGGGAHGLAYGDGSRYGSDRFQSPAAPLHQSRSQLVPQLQLAGSTATASYSPAYSQENAATSGGAPASAFYTPGGSMYPPQQRASPNGSGAPAGPPPSIGGGYTSDFSISGATSGPGYDRFGRPGTMNGGISANERASDAALSSDAYHAGASSSAGVKSLQQQHLHQYQQHPNGTPGHQSTSLAPSPHGYITSRTKEGDADHPGSSSRGGSSGRARNPYNINAASMMQPTRLW